MSDPNGGLALLQAYEEVAAAVAYCELFVFEPDETGESAWDLMNGSDLSLDDRVLFIRDCIECDVGDPRRVAEAKAQTRHPKFRTYLAAKMGML